MKSLREANRLLDTVNSTLTTNVANDITQSGTATTIRTNLTTLSARVTTNSGTAGTIRTNLTTLSGRVTTNSGTMNILGMTIRSTPYLISGSMYFPVIISGVQRRISASGLRASFGW